MITKFSNRLKLSPSAWAFIVFVWGGTASLAAAFMANGWSFTDALTLLLAPALLNVAVLGLGMWLGSAKANGAEA